MRYDFMILDVFTDRPFGGNQLAVLTDARGISADGMQAIAREFNFPETTFVLPPDDPANVRRVRIFTPGGELPFAGHPTVGTACALAIAGKVPVGDAVLEEGVGPVAVTTWHEHGAYFARLRVERGPETSDVVPTAEDVAAVLSLDPSEVLDLFCAGLGPRFTFVRSRHARRSTGRSWTWRSGAGCSRIRGARRSTSLPVSSRTARRSTRACSRRRSGFPRTRRRARPLPPSSVPRRPEVVTARSG